MRSTFWKGVIAGTMMAAAMSMYIIPKRRRAIERQRGLLGTTRRAGARAQRVVKGVSKTVSQLMQ